MLGVLLCLDHSGDPNPRYFLKSIRERKKTHKYKQVCGIVPGLRGCQNFVYVFFFFGSFLMGEKKHINKMPPKIPGQSREHFVYVFFSLCVFLFSKALPYSPLSFLVFRNSFCFFPLLGIPCFFRAFSLFPRDFRGPVGRKKPCSLVGFPCQFPKARKGRTQNGRRPAVWEAYHRCKNHYRPE